MRMTGLEAYEKLEKLKEDIPTMENLVLDKNRQLIDAYTYRDEVSNNSANLDISTLEEELELLDADIIRLQKELFALEDASMNLIQQESKIRERLSLVEFFII